MIASEWYLHCEFLISPLCPNNNIRYGREAFEIGSRRSSELNARCYVVFLTLPDFASFPPESSD